MFIIWIWKLQALAQSESADEGRAEELNAKPLKTNQV